MKPAPEPLNLVDHVSNNMTSTTCDGLHNYPVLLSLNDKGFTIGINLTRIM